MTRDDERGTGEPPRKVPGREPFAPPPRKRFYKDVTVEPAEDGSPAFRILLDGRPVKTPRKRAFAVGSAALAEAIASEWRAQGSHVDPAQMPLTRIANSAIDAVAEAMPEVAADIVAFAGSDLLCYRAEGPTALADRQADRWDPVLAWVEETLAAPFRVAVGVMPVAQDQAPLDRVAAALAGYDACELAALHVMTTLTGSALLALAHAQGRLSVDEAWDAAHIDEDHQIELWGRDEEAEARRARRKAEFEAASRFFADARQGRGR